MVFNENMEMLRKHQPGLARQVEQTELTGKATLFMTDDNDQVNLAYEDIALHRMADPLGEAKEVYLKGVPEDNRGDDGVTFIFGLGLGYLLRRAFIESTGQIIVFEPYLEVLRQTFEIVDFTNELSSPRVQIITQVEQIVKAYATRFLMGDSFTTIALPAYHAKEPELYLKVLTELKSVMVLTAVGQNTAMGAGQNFVSSSLKNIQYSLKYPEISFINQKFKGKPAVVISAGPSLDRPGVMDCLKEHRDNIIIAAVGQACKALDAAGITPDFVMILESKNVSMQINGVSFMPDTNLVLMPQAHSTLFEENQAKRIFVSHAVADPVKAWLSKALNRKIYGYYTQGTVSVMALAQVIQMGCSPILLLGQDLAFPEGKMYASNAAYKNWRITEDENGRKSFDMDNPEELVGVFVKDMETWERRRKEVPNGFMKTKGWNGEDLYTRMGYLSFKKTLEYMNLLFKQTHIVNCSEGGAYIDGMDHLPFIEAMEKFNVKDFSPKPELTALLEEHYYVKPDDDEDYQNVYKQYINDKQDLESLQEIADEATKKLEKIRRTLKNRPVINDRVQEELMRLSELDRTMTHVTKQNGIINAYVRKELFKFSKDYNRKHVLEQVETEVGDVEALKDNLEISESLYKAIKIGSKKLIKAFDAAFKEFPGARKDVPETMGTIVLEQPVKSNQKTSSKKR